VPPLSNNKDYGWVGVLPVPKLCFRLSAIVPSTTPGLRVVTFHVRYLSPPGIEAPETRPGALTIEVPEAAAQALETSADLILLLAPNLEPERRARLFRLKL
jgi:hypothetical protein